MSVQAAFDSDTFRKVMGHFVTGVTVVTTLEDGRPQGITVNALSSVSLEPPLVVVALDRRRYITPKIHAAGTFAVNVLGEHQQDLADCLRVPRSNPAERTSAPPLDPRPHRLAAARRGDRDPRMHGSRGPSIGDHDLFIGRVEALHNDEHHPQPLLYYRRRYLRVERSESITIEGRQEG